MGSELQALARRFGSLQLRDYVHQHLLKKREHAPLNPEAYEVFTKNFKGKEIYHLATGSHMALLQWDNPYELSEAVLANLPFLLGEGETVPLAPCSRISFSNTTRPGMIDCSGLGKGNVHLSKYVLRGRSKTLVMKAPPLQQEEIENFLHPFEKMQQRPDLFPFVSQNNLKLFISAFRRAPQQGKTFPEQASWLGSALWPALFKDKQQKLIIKPVESMVLLRENILEDVKIRGLLEKHFSGVRGAMSSTYFYYGICSCGAEFPLKKEEEALQGKCLACEESGLMNVPIVDLPEAIKRQDVSETLLMTYYNLWLQTGVEVFGGSFQIEYLKDFKQRLSRVFSLIGEKKKSAILQRRSSDLFDCGMFVKYNADGTPKTGAQILLEGGFHENDLRTLAQQPFQKMTALLQPPLKHPTGIAPGPEMIQAIRQEKMEALI